MAIVRVKDQVEDVENSRRARRIVRESVCRVEAEVGDISVEGIAEDRPSGLARCRERARGCPPHVGIGLGEATAERRDEIRCGERQVRDGPRGGETDVRVGVDERRSERPYAPKDRSAASDQGHAAARWAAASSRRDASRRRSTARAIRRAVGGSCDGPDGTSSGGGASCGWRSASVPEGLEGARSRASASAASALREGQARARVRAAVARSSALPMAPSAVIASLARMAAVSA